MLTTTGHTYEDAIAALNTLQSSFKVIEERKAAGQKLDENAIREMREWVRRIGYKCSDLDKLNVVHVAGTKGKGTTCAYVNSILGFYNQTLGIPKKVGLYTSPHLVHVTERIQINSKPISKELFTRYFFEVWDALETSANAKGLDPLWKPVYFRFLTLLSFHVFLSEGVDAAIYEVGVGGEFDSTNVFESPAVTGITTLGIDHVATLGDTIEAISWHKAGIFKSGSPAFSVEQLPAAADVLIKRAQEKGLHLEFVSQHPALKNVKIIPDADFQRGNASVAIALTEKLLQRLGHPVLSASDHLPAEFRRGLEEVKWPGRCEVKIQGQIRWYLDGAHTADSLKVAATWFSTQASTDIPIRILIFNQQTRPEAAELLALFQKSLAANRAPSFTHVIFCTNVTFKEQGYKPDHVDRNTDPSVVASLTVQKLFAGLWTKGGHSSDAKIMHLATIEEAVNFAQELGAGKEGTQILVTGSFRHVGGVLAIIDRQNA